MPPTCSATSSSTLDLPSKPCLWARPLHLATIVRRAIGDPHAATTSVCAAPRARTARWAEAAFTTARPITRQGSSVRPKPRRARGGASADVGEDATGSEAVASAPVDDRRRAATPRARAAGLCGDVGPFTKGDVQMRSARLVIGLLSLAALAGLLALPAGAHGKRPPPAVCSATSEWSCAGMLVGSICEDGRCGGTCKQLRGSEDCFCYFGRKARFCD